MAVILDATSTWSNPVTLNADEVWQARDGGLYVTTTASPVANDGLHLKSDQSIRFSAGSVIMYRKASNEAVMIAREIV